MVETVSRISSDSLRDVIVTSLVWRGVVDIKDRGVDNARHFGGAIGFDDVTSLFDDVTTLSGMAERSLRHKLSDIVLKGGI